MDLTELKRGTLRDSVVPLDADATLLDYEILPQPNPLQAGAAGAMLTLAVSNGTRTMVTCSEIALTVVVGTAARALVADATGITTVAPQGWSVAQDAGTFTLTPDTPEAGQIGPRGLSFVFAALDINDQVGTTQVTIDETAFTPTHPRQERTGIIPLPKFPTRFTVSDLSVKPLEVSAGDSATVNWSGSPAEYALAFNPGSGMQTVTVGSLGPYVAEDLTRYPQVVFTLIVSYADPGQDQPLVVQKQASVQVDPLLPVVTSFSGHASGGQAWFDWASQNADSCTLNALPQLLNPSGQAVLLPAGRIRYSLVANSSRTRTSSAPSLVDLRMSVARQQSLDGSGRWLGMAGDGASLVVILHSAESSICLVDRATLRVTDRMSAQPVGSCFALSPDGTRLVTCTRDSARRDHLTLITIPELTRLDVPLPFPSALGAAFSPDGATIYVAGGDPPSVSVYDASLVQQRSFPVPDIGNCAVSADGSRLYIVGDTQLLIADTATGAIQGTPPIGFNGRGAIVLDSVHNRAYVSSDNAGVVNVVDLAAMTTLSQIRIRGGPRALVVGAGGDEIYVGKYASDSLSVIEANTLAVIATFPLPDRSTAGLAFSPGPPMKLYALTDNNREGAALSVLEVTS